MPSLGELSERYGDKRNTKLYAMSRDIEGRWLDLHERETGAKHPIDRDAIKGLVTDFKDAVSAFSRR